MSHIQNSKKLNLYFPKRITEAMVKISDYPLTLVEAPMGYGKTTAVRENIILTGTVILLWQNIYDDSKAAFWAGFCHLFSDLDTKRSHNLAELGFPDDSASMYAALMLIKNIAIPDQTVIVIDDFHLVDTQETASFIIFLAANNIANLHIVLISRFFEFFIIEELSLKGYLYHIKKESFEFSQKEIIDYYKCCGISITDDEADGLYNLTEGWISALYLLMLNFKETGSIVTSVNIYKLIEQSVYDPFSDIIKIFLLSMSLYNNFTPEQADYMMPDNHIEEIINEITGRNAFIMYDPIQKSYHIHSIFKNFLLNKLNLMPKSFQTELYKKVAKWYLQIGDYLLSMRYSYLVGDFDTLLHSLELDKGQNINGEHRELLTKYFDDCPLEEKIRHPYAVLIYARRMCNHGKGTEEIMDAERLYYTGDFQNAEIAMHKAYQAAMETPDIMLCIIFLNIKLSFMKGDLTGLLKLFKNMRDDVFEKKWHMCIHTIDICEAYIYSCLHMNEKVAPWVKSGEFQSTRLLFPSLAYLNIVYGKVLLESCEYVKLLGRAEEFLNMACVYPNLLAQIYTYIYIAAANAKISRTNDAETALKQAMSIAMPDKLYMPFAENGEIIKPLLEALQTQNIYTDDVSKILKLYGQYHKSAMHIINEYSTQNKTALTERENEIASFAVQGLSNKEIGKRLYISENTVKTHLKSVFEKLNINSRTMLKQKLDI